MRRGTWLQACVGVAALAFTSGAAAQGRGPGPFAGSFSVASNTTVSVTSPMAITEERTTRERLEITPGARSDASIQVTNDLGEHCTLTANRSGASGISFGSGQHCTFTDSVRNMRMNFTLRSGTGSISGDSLSLNFSWNVSSNGGFLSIAGSASQRSSGRRTGGRAMADTNAAPVEVPTPAIAVAPQQPSFPAAVVPVPEVAAAPMMPMTGTPARSTTRHPSSTAARPQAPVVAPTPIVAVVPAPVPAPTGATAWGSPNPSAPTQAAPASAWGAPSAAPAAPAATSWTTPSTASGGWGAPSGVPQPINANTPGAVVLASGWILGPLYSVVASAAPAASQAANAWTNQPSAPTPSVGVPWGSSAPSNNSAWAPSAGGPGVVLGGSSGAPSQGFGVTVNPSPSRPANPQGTSPNGPGIVFSATP